MSFLIRGHEMAILIGIALIILSVFSGQAAAQRFPVCGDPASDTDGDGFGWENRSSCRVIARTATRVKFCLRPDSDPDGDGFGWENGMSCKVGSSSSARPGCQQAGSDPDGDGFGWENGQSCVVGESSGGDSRGEERYTIKHPACSATKYDPDGDGFGWENSTTCTSYNSGDGGRGITDLVLVTGQSNALGAETAMFDPGSYDEDLDSPVKRVYVYTRTGWSIASLRQIWDLNWYPRADIAKKPANNFAFHFAKNVALNDPKRVVGFILVTAPGAQIAHWDKGERFYSSIQRKVQRALDALPHKNRVDAILWHQGETDYYSTDYYQLKLNQLIGNFRSERWVSYNAPFICGETFESPVNQRLMALNKDSDRNTACVSANGLRTVGDNIHFTASSLRILGARYAAKYLEILNY